MPPPEELRPIASHWTVRIKSPGAPERHGGSVPGREITSPKASPPPPTAWCQQSGHRAQPAEFPWVTFPPGPRSALEKRGLAAEGVWGTSARARGRSSWVRRATQDRPPDAEFAYRGGGQRRAPLRLRGARERDPLCRSSPRPEQRERRPGDSPQARRGAAGSLARSRISSPPGPDRSFARRHSPCPQPGGAAAAAAPLNWQLSAVRNNTSSLCAASHWLPGHATLPRSSNRRGPVER